MNLNSKILITGSRGLVGTAVAKELNRNGYFNLSLLSRNECDLLNFQESKKFICNESPDIIIHTAASVFGIGGNKKNPGEIFLYNTLINTHVIECARLSGCKKIVAVGTVAAYPENIFSPLKECDVWNGPPHDSEASYGHAKRGMLAQLKAYKQNYGLDYAYLFSTNLYGPNDKFDKENGHVIPSLILKFFEANMNNHPLHVWGDGSAKRDFLFSNDFARALVLIMRNFSGEINVASGVSVSIKSVVELLVEYFDFSSSVVWESKKPNGRGNLQLDLSKLSSLGFVPAYSLDKGLIETIEWFKEKYPNKTFRS